MEIKELKLKGVFEIQLSPLRDNRGFFMRSYDEKTFEKYGLCIEWVQENHSRSIQKGIIRGLHFQLLPYIETKLVRCIRGSIQDVFLDLRKGSSTFGQWDSIILNEDKFNCVYIPKGFAHGFCTMTEFCEVIYKVDNYYAPEYECGIIWNDEDLKIDWKIDKPILSEKDKKNLSMKEFIDKYGGVDV